MLTKEQIEKVRDAIKTLISADRALAANPCIGTAQQHDNAFQEVVRLTRKFGPRLCDMAFAWLEAQPRPIEEAPNDGRIDLLWSPDASHKWMLGLSVDFGDWMDAYGNVMIDAEPTHFIPLSALPTPAGRE